MTRISFSGFHLSFKQKCKLPQGHFPVFDRISPFFIQMLTVKLLSVWAVEIISETILLTLLVALFSFSEDSFWRRFPRDLLASIYIILTFMFLSGYLLTTGYLRIIWKSHRIWDHSAVTTILAVLVLQIFYMIAEGWEKSFKIKLQLVSAVVVFSCTFAGGWFIKKYLYNAYPIRT